MTINELSALIRKNDIELSFQGEKFFIATKYNLKSKDVNNIEVQLFLEDFLRQTLDYNYRIANTCFIITSEITLTLNGIEYAVERTERFIERQDGWLKYKITDVNTENDSVLQEFNVYKEAEVVNLCR